MGEDVSRSAGHRFDAASMSSGHGNAFTIARTVSPASTIGLIWVGEANPACGLPSQMAPAQNQHSIVLVIKLVYLDLVRQRVYLKTNDVLYQAKLKLVCDHITQNDPVSYADSWAGKSFERNAGIPYRPPAVTPWQRAAGLDTHEVVLSPGVDFQCPVVEPGTVLNCRYRYAVAAVSSRWLLGPSRYDQ